MGKVINQKYEILEKIDESDRLYVYKSRDIKTNRPVIIKILRKKWLSDQKLLEFFNNELENISSLNHPNICKIYDVDYINNVYYVVMEYFDGISLFELIEKETYFTVLQAINIVMQLGKVLIYAASNGVTERNVKLNDIIVNRIGRIKITNFSTPMSKIRRTLTPINSRASTNSDIFFLGFILYTLIMGKFPDKMRGIVDITSTKISDKISWNLSERKLKKKETQELQNIIESSTSMDFNSRIKKIEDLLKKLDNFIKKHPDLLEREEFNHVEEDETNKVKDLLSDSSDEKNVKKEEKPDFNDGEEVIDQEKEIIFEKKFDSSNLIWGKAPEESFASKLFTPSTFIIAIVIILAYLLYFLKF